MIAILLRKRSTYNKLTRTATVTKSFRPGLKDFFGSMVGVAVATSPVSVACGLFLVTRIAKVGDEEPTWAENDISLLV